MNSNEGIRWVFDSGDLKAHVLADVNPAHPETVTTMCGRQLPATTLILTSPPWLMACEICEPVSRLDRPPPTFPTHF